VLDHVAKTEHAWVRRELRAAWKLTDAHAAKTALETLARKLDRINPDAAGSLREGLDETLTITRLGVTGTLAKTLATTNPMESTIDIVRVHARNVKRCVTATCDSAGPPPGCSVPKPNTDASRATSNSTSSPTHSTRTPRPRSRLDHHEKLDTGPTPKFNGKPDILLCSPRAPRLIG